MSMHKKPLTKLEEEGLRQSGLPVGTPSQLSDSFVLGMQWQKNKTGNSMETKERYKHYIETKMQYLYHKRQMERMKGMCRALLLMSENDDQWHINGNAAKDAFKILSDEFEVQKADYVATELKYMGDTFSLHDPELGLKALWNIIKA